MDTIFAQASAPGRAGISVVRVSGPRALEICRVVAGDVPQPGRVALRPIRDAKGGLIDQALVLTFIGPRSFTGEDVLELHLHGSIAVMRAVLDVLSGFEGARIAEAGEFTRRALENDKLNLAQVEGLADLIEAETESQRKQAQSLFSGKLGALVESWRSRLIRAAALLEATIDFVDEEVPVDVSPEVSSLLESVHSELAKEIAGTYVAERIRSGFEVAIVGPPNAGKSTLLNALAGRGAAITSEFAGTTRDVIEVRMDLDGIPVTILDTAGVRKTDDVVEKEGVDRAIARANAADLRIFLAEAGELGEIVQQKDDLRVSPKADLRVDGCGVSGLTGLGVDRLVGDVSQILKGRQQNVGLATHQRHRFAMSMAVDHLDTTRDLLLQGPDIYDIVAAELRLAIFALEALIGQVDVENLLDEIFSSFCIGK